MRALAADTELALADSLADLGLDWTVGRRTGDSSSSQRAKLRRAPPTALITTPESLSLLLTYGDFLFSFINQLPGKTDYYLCFSSSLS